MANLAVGAEEQAAAGFLDARPRRATFLMCPPEFYDVGYVINPWMAGNLHRPTRDRAFSQWRGLYEELRKIADVRLLPPRPGAPDMVFVAHAAVVHFGVAAVSSFAHRQRQAEEKYLHEWLEQNEFLLWTTPRETAFEGEGDTLLDPTLGCVWAAHGPRTCVQSHRHLADAWHAEVRSLHLVDPRFFHLDTCFAPLSGGWMVYFPEAFDRSSQAALEAAYPSERRIAVDEAEATRFGCSLVNVGQQVLMHRLSPTGPAEKNALPARLRAAGYKVCELPLDEFVKGGGAAKSLALRLSDLAVTHRAPL